MNWNGRRRGPRFWITAALLAAAALGSTVAVVRAVRLDLRRLEAQLLEAKRLRRDEGAREMRAQHDAALARGKKESESYRQLEIKRIEVAGLRRRGGEWAALHHFEGYADAKIKQFWLTMPGCRFRWCGESSGVITIFTYVGKSERLNPIESLPLGGTASRNTFATAGQRDRWREESQTGIVNLPEGDYAFTVRTAGHWFFDVEE